MTAPIADTLVLVFTAGVSLRTWRDLGMISREWAIYRELLPRYGRIVLVTYGGADDPGILHDHLTPDERSKVVVISNTAAAPQQDYAQELPARVRATIGADATIVVKTNQMQGGETAVNITEALRAAGKTAALVARGGYLWTRFIAYEQGPQSSAALTAAQREKSLCQAADMVVGTTSEMIEDLAWRYGLELSRCVVVPNYVNVEQDPPPAMEREPGLLLYAGQLSKRKSVDVLVNAVAMLPDEIRGTVCLEIYGDGDQRQSLDKLVRELNAPVRIYPRIPHEKLLERMSRCSIYLQSSELEGHPKTVLEAMAAGAPVLVAKTPGLAEVVTHGMNGLRIEPTAQAFATAIEELLRDEEWRDVLGSAAARTIRNEVGLQRIVPIELDVHKRALSHAARANLRASA